MTEQSERHCVAMIPPESHLRRDRQGVCIWFTGRTCVGAPAVAQVLAKRLLEYGREATTLDADVVRTHLSAGLGFPREDLDTIIRRIGFVAAEIVRHKGTVICAVVSPQQIVRREIQSAIGVGKLIEVFVDTRCASRESRSSDKARQALPDEFAGIVLTDEVDASGIVPQITIRDISWSRDENVRAIIQFLMLQGFIGPDPCVVRKAYGNSSVVNAVGISESKLATEDGITRLDEFGETTRPPETPGTNAMDDVIVAHSARRCGPDPIRWTD